MELLLLDRSAALIPRLPHDLEAGAADRGDQAAERLELILVVPGAVQPFVEGEEALVEDGEIGEEVPGGVEGPEPELPCQANGVSFDSTFQLYVA